MVLRVLSEGSAPASVVFLCCFRHRQRKGLKFPPHHPNFPLFCLCLPEVSRRIPSMEPAPVRTGHNAGLIAVWILFFAIPAQRKDARPATAWRALPTLSHHCTARHSAELQQSTRHVRVGAFLMAGSSLHLYSESLLALSLWDSQGTPLLHPWVS